MEIVIGYDINEYYAQISYAAQGQEPETLEFPTQKEEGNIELAVCKRNGVNQWFCGKEAVRKGVSGEGTLVENLWQLLEEDITVTIEKQEYPVDKLCNLFLGRTLDWAIRRLEEICGEEISIRCMVVTSDLWSETMRVHTDVLTQGLPIDKSRIVFQGHDDSLYSYIVHQSQKLLGYEIGVFDLTSEQMISYRIQVNHKTRPMVVSMEKEYVQGFLRRKRYDSVMENDRQLAALDLQLKAYAEGFIQGHIMSGLYLIGDGFRGDWYQESLPVLCRNRKVFAGNNLYGKGACYSALERMWPGEISKQFLFLGKDMLRYNVGITMYDGDAEEYYPLLDAGTNWYDAKAEITFMMEEAETIELLITPLDGSGSYVETLKLPVMPKREFRAFQMSLCAQMQSVSQLFICVKDEGFGEIFEKTPVGMTYDLTFGEEG